MIEKEKLQMYAEKLFFRMNDEEYATLQQEFDVILKQMDIIDKIEGISNVEPMTFPFEKEGTVFREDIANDNLKPEEVVKNAKDVYFEQVKVPKVVE